MYQSFETKLIAFMAPSNSLQSVSCDIFTAQNHPSLAQCIMGRPQWSSCLCVTVLPLNAPDTWTALQICSDKDTVDPGSWKAS